MDQVHARTRHIVMEQIRWHRVTLLVMVLLTVVATIFDVLSPLLFRFLIDEAIPSADTTLITRVLIGMVLLPVAASVLSFLEGRQRSRIGIAITRALREQVFAHMLSVRIADLEQQKSGELFQNLTRTCGEVGEVFVSDNLLPLIPRVLLLVGNVAAMLVTSWRLAVVTLIAVPLLFGFSLLFRKYALNLVDKFYVLLDAGSSMVHETLAGLRTIRAFNGQPRERLRWQQWNAQYRATKLEVETFHDFLVHTLSLFITNLVLAIVLGFGVFEILSGRLSVGGLVAFIVYAPRVLAVLQQLSRTQISLSTMQVASTRLDALFALPSERQGGVALPVTAHHERGVRVEFDDVSFQYGRGTAGVSHLSFAINPGEFIGMVGPSGGGKSTIFDLLSGFYEPDAGRILVDGVDLRQLSLAALREATGIVAQEPFLWNASLVANLTYPGDISSDHPDFAWTVQAAQLESFIAGLPEGYQTLIGERGQALSGGERQRIAIARAMLRKPRLLLLDEATSALDAITEEKLRHALESIRKGRTMIVIAHRLATITQADRIIVIDQGQVVEQGSPADLLARRGLYYAFHQAQNLETMPPPPPND